MPEWRRRGLRSRGRADTHSGTRRRSWPAVAVRAIAVRASGVSGFVIARTVAAATAVVTRGAAERDAAPGQRREARPQQRIERRPGGAQVFAVLEWVIEARQQHHADSDRDCQRDEAGSVCARSRESPSIRKQRHEQQAAGHVTEQLERAEHAEATDPRIERRPGEELLQPSQEAADAQLRHPERAGTVVELRARGDDPRDQAGQGYRAECRDEDDGSRVFVDGSPPPSTT